MTEKEVTMCIAKGNDVNFKGVISQPQVRQGEKIPVWKSYRDLFAQLDITGTTARTVLAILATSRGRELYHHQDNDDDNDDKWNNNDNVRDPTTKRLLAPFV